MVGIGKEGKNERERKTEEMLLQGRLTGRKEREEENDDASKSPSNFK